MIHFRHFLFKKIFRPPPYEEFLEINFHFLFLYCINFTRIKVAIVSSVMVRTSDLYISFLPLLHIDIHFLQTTRNSQIPNSKLDLVRYSQFCCENKMECKQTVSKLSRKMIKNWGTYQTALNQSFWNLRS
jgi:hypothetical protein